MMVLVDSKFWFRFPFIIDHPCINVIVCIVQVAGRAPAGVAPEGTPARHLLPPVALAGPAESPRATRHRQLRVRIQPEERRGLRKSVPLHANRDSR